MDSNNTLLPSTEPSNAKELQSSHSPARSATYSPSGDHNGVPDQNGVKDTTMGEQLRFPRQNLAEYAPSLSYAAPEGQHSAAQADSCGGYEFRNPQAPAGNAYSPYSAAPTHYSDDVHYTNGYSPQSPGQFQAAPVSPFSPSSPSHQYPPNVASPPSNYSSNFMNLSPTQYTSQAYPPDARSAEASSPHVNGNDAPFCRSPAPSSPRRQNSFREQNGYAGLRAPENFSISPLGPFGAGAAVSVSDFQGYPQADLNNPNHRSLLRIHTALPHRPRPDLEFSVSPVVELGPGSDPPPLASQHIPKNNREKYIDANIPDRFEQFILTDGEKKCVGKPDTRTPNSAIFTFAKEDHTLANLLKNQLMKDKRVLFSGYKVAHPLIPNFELRVQTDGTITPKEALVSCCRAIVVDLDTLSREFTKEFELRKIVAGDPKD